MPMVFVAIVLTAFTVIPASASEPCGPEGNPITCENSKPGTDRSVWDIAGAGDPTIQGYSTDISVAAGAKIAFKIDTDAPDYTIEIYRTGWYQGLGARKIASVTPSTALPQQQPQCISDVSTELYDCGTWSVSASWNVPADAVSGVYVALLTRVDTGGRSHIIFIVRDTASHSDVLLQTSDPTWQAYNNYGGSDFYQGAANGRAFKISYNRPFATRGGTTNHDFYFASEYPLVRFLEKNGYDVSYFSGADTDRYGAALLNHRVFISVGHDEYWSAAQRANVEAARDAGVNLQFLSGNEVYWHTRYEPSTDASVTPYRTLVSYKETWANGKIDPEQEWTGTWRDPRFASQSEGAGLPENALTGTLYKSNFTDLPVTVNATEGKMRLWRNTSLASLPAGTSVALAPHTVGYESDEDFDNAFRPDGLIHLSTTTGEVPQYLQDYGNRTEPGSTTHHVTMYRAVSGALVFSAGSIQWTWGLDQAHDGDGAAPDRRMQQAQVNLLADMAAQPRTLDPALTPATASTDHTAPEATITTPAATFCGSSTIWRQPAPKLLRAPKGVIVANGSTVAVSGTATDAEGQVAGVEISLDGGDTWHAATGTTVWSYSYSRRGIGSASIYARAIDDSGNIQLAGSCARTNAVGPYTALGSGTPQMPDAGDAAGVELGLRFTPSTNGYVVGVRFYKSEQNTGVHKGALWDWAGRQLATVTFSDESPTGWQTANFARPIEVTGGNSYVVSYSAPNGHYAAESYAWADQGMDKGPLLIAGGLDSEPAGVFGAVGEFPTKTFRSSNYYVDATFDTTDDSMLAVGPRDDDTDGGS